GGGAVHRLDDRAGNAVGRLSGFEIGFESVELGLKRHDGSPCVCVEDGGAVRFVEVTCWKLKETAVSGSGVVGLEIIPVRNDHRPGQHPRQMISLRSSSWSNCCCSRSHAETAFDSGASARCGCRWPTGASQGRCEVSTIDGLRATAEFDPLASA